MNNNSTTGNGVGEFVKLKTVEEMNAGLTPQERYSFLYVDVELELIKEGLDERPQQ